jgi:putative protein-disulfide isomerase
MFAARGGDFSGLRQAVSGTSFSEPQQNSRSFRKGQTNQEDKKQKRSGRMALPRGTSQTLSAEARLNVSVKPLSCHCSGPRVTISPSRALTEPVLRGRSPGKTMSEPTDPATIEPVGTLYYFGDPMCSWCWGFKPVLEQVDQEYPELKRVTVMGGLRGGEEVPMNDALAEMIRNAWFRIEETTGQHFNHDLWKQHRPLATTWPACRAVLSARLLDPKAEWSFMVAMFQAYFTRALDPSQRETHLLIADEQGLSSDEFETLLDSEQVEKVLQKDLLTTQRYGITGFPSVVLAVGGNNYLIAPGYQPVEGMRKAINTVYGKAGIEFVRPESGIYS